MTHYLQDGLGSVRGLANASGALTQDYAYEPYGTPEGATPTDFGFTGEQTDSNGQIYLRARYYDPATGVFTALDPFEGTMQRPMSMNGYSWVEGNTINATDPSGKSIRLSRFLNGGVCQASGIGSSSNCYAVCFGPCIWVCDGVPLPPGRLPDDILEDAAEEIEDFAEGFVEGFMEGIFFGLFSDSSSDTPDTTTDTPEDNQECDPAFFTIWWATLPHVPESYRPDEDWYEYEQRVARAGGLYGDHTRTIVEGPIDADGIEPSICYLVDAKHARNPRNPQYRLDSPPWIDSDDETELRDGLARYKSAIDNSEPMGLIIRTNAAASVPFFEALLVEVGFTLGVDGSVGMFD